MCNGSVCGGGKRAKINTEKSATYSNIQYSIASSLVGNTVVEIGTVHFITHLNTGDMDT
jgi:hypothetical protein